jgi:hypothetical protein
MEDWFELENDEGVFTLLLEELDVRNAEAVLVWDLSACEQDTLFDTIYGLILLFRWDKNRGDRNRKQQQQQQRTKHNSSSGNPAFESGSGSTTQSSQVSTTHPVETIDRCFLRNKTCKAVAQ